MKTSQMDTPLLARRVGTSGLVALALAAPAAFAGEGYKLRQSPVGLFGGEMAATAENPGFFGTAALSFTNIYKIVDSNGDNVTVPGRSIPLPTGTPTSGRVPNGTYTLNVPVGTLEFKQDQTQLNLAGGYLTETLYGDGRWAFAINLPLIKQSRTFKPAQSLGTISPAVGAPLPAALQGAINAVGAAANAQVQAAVAAGAATQNVDTTGIGDTELSAVWIRHQGQMKVVAGVSVYLPTGSYDKDRGPNPGFGDFYTIRPGVAVTYALNPNHADASWDSGVTVAGRVSFGVNTTNKATDYRSGNFIYLEGGAMKVTGNWAFGANLLLIQQVTDDTAPVAPVAGFRYKNYGFGPFLSYKIPGQDAGFNLHYSENFGSSNALVSKTWQLRFIKAW